MSFLALFVPCIWCAICESCGALVLFSVALCCQDDDLKSLSYYGVSDGWEVLLEEVDPRDVARQVGRGTIYSYFCHVCFVCFVCFSLFFFVLFVLID